MNPGEVAEALRRVTVQVRIDEGRAGGGSGVVWDATGRIVSNAHVVRGENIEIEFLDGRVVSARLLKRDPRRDLALLAVEAEAAPANWGDSSTLERGDTVVAVGNPLGFVGALSNGVFDGEGMMGGQRWLRSRILLAPGNSGGALADAAGRVVGINTMVAGPHGFAVPSREVARFIERAAEGPRLGVTVEPMALDGGAHPRWAFRIQSVAPRSRAELASLRAGDVIIGVDGEFFTSQDGLETRLNQQGLVRMQFFRGRGSGMREVHIDLGGDERRIRTAA